jgi:hypothetical protein
VASIAAAEKIVGASIRPALPVSLRVLISAFRFCGIIRSTLIVATFGTMLPIWLRQTGSADLDQFSSRKGRNL